MSAETQSNTTSKFLKQHGKIERNATLLLVLSLVDLPMKRVIFVAEKSLLRPYLETQQCGGG